jgi:hypothetical protein
MFFRLIYWSACVLLMHGIIYVSCLSVDGCMHSKFSDIQKKKRVFSIWKYYRRIHACTCFEYYVHLQFLWKNDLFCWRDFVFCTQSWCITPSFLSCYAQKGVFLLFSFVICNHTSWFRWKGSYEPNQVICTKSKGCNSNSIIFLHWDATVTCTHKLVTNLKFGIWLSSLILHVYLLYVYRALMIYCNFFLFLSKSC